jgi:hypothetical protein
MAKFWWSFCALGAGNTSQLRRPIRLRIVDFQFTGPSGNIARSDYRLRLYFGLPVLD